MALELQYRLYALLHLSVKKILRRYSLSESQSIYKYKSYDLGIEKESTSQFWEEFISNSKIENQSNFSGFYYAGFVLEKSEWILPSWIWTNAIIVKVMLELDKREDAETLGKLLASKQKECGGWIVRYDYDDRGPIPMLAPNDSAYIANNAFLSLYSYTGEKKYLDIAEQCAHWIMASRRDDGIVSTGYNMRDKKWSENAIIVDIGFTAGLFANLYKITQKEIYKLFLQKFSYRYIELFFNSKFKGFSTSIDKNDQQQGGFFGRGQAWALEGLIPAYKVLRDPKLEQVIEKTVSRLIDLQNPDGSWAYNLSRKLMGKDCKGVPVIAKSLADWYEIKPTTSLLKAIEKAFDWCCKHTKKTGKGKGGIFSFCTEGGIVKDLYSSCAFVYASAYAIEIDRFIFFNDENNNPYRHIG